jgi:hypothetical protein
MAGHGAIWQTEASNALKAHPGQRVFFSCFLSVAHQILFCVFNRSISEAQAAVGGEEGLSCRSTFIQSRLNIY